MSSPRACSSIVSQIPNAPQSSSSSRKTQHALTSLCSATPRIGTGRRPVPAGPKSAPGSTSPNETSRTVAVGFSRSSSNGRSSASSRSVFVTTSVSAAATCRTDSGSGSPLTASTVAITRSSLKWCLTTGSESSV